MTPEANPVGPQPDGFPDSEPAEEVVNDSLGTVDAADSSGLDANEEPEAGKPISATTPADAARPGPG